MDRNIYTINHRGLPLGESLIDFKYGSGLFVDFPESEIAGGEGEVKIEVLKHASMMELFFTIKGTVEIPCDRCLDLYSQEIDLEADLIVKISETEGEYDGDIIWLNPREDALDLKQWIFETIVLSLPLQRVHSSKDECDPEALKYIAGEVDANQLEEEEEE
ncbi:MAG: DUF177 domain-containing protein [Rikenellaceae bacterium]